MGKMQRYQETEVKQSRSRTFYKMIFAKFQEKQSNVQETEEGGILFQ